MDARKMHKMYAEYMANVLAIPVIMGEKTVEERFAGADHTDAKSALNFERIVLEGVR